MTEHFTEPSSTQARMIEGLAGGVSSIAHTYSASLLGQRVRLNDAVKLAGFTGRALEYLGSALEAEGRLVTRTWPVDGQIRKGGGKAMSVKNAVDALGRSAQLVDRSGHLLNGVHRRMSAALAPVQDKYHGTPNVVARTGLAALIDQTLKLGDTVAATQYMTRSTAHRHLIGHLSLTMGELMRVPMTLYTLMLEGLEEQPVRGQMPGLMRGKVPRTVKLSKPELHAARLILTGRTRALVHLHGQFDRA